MKFFMGIVVLICYCLNPARGLSQDAPDKANNAINIPSSFFNHIRHKTADLDQQLTRQTEKYLQKMARREARMQQQLNKLDPAAANALFAGSAQQYAALAQKMQQDTGSRGASISDEYQPYTDSLNGMLKFLGQSSSLQGARAAAAQLQTLQAKMQDADQVKEYIRQRRQQIGDYISQHAGLAGALGRQYQGMKEGQFYFAQQVRQYKEMLNDPDKVETQALAILSKLPGFQTYMKNFGQLGGLFNLPSNYQSPATLAGLQTRDQVSALINSQVGAGGQAALQANLQSAQSQLDGYKDKLSQLGRGSGDIDMPDFKPNSQKTKAFWKRLEYGANFQTTRNNYYFPTVSDLGLSIGYKINNSSTVGIGVSYKLGWGNGINHVALSNSGAAIRSFIDIRITSSFLASGGFELNRTVPFSSLQQLHKIDAWTTSGLFGISKTVSVKSRVFKKTKLSLLWDFLSYQQSPKKQPILFRIGYQF